MKHGCRAAMTFLVYCQRFWLTARLPKAVEKSDKKRLIQRSQILWQKGRDSEAPTLHQKAKRERERLQTYQKRFQDSETGPKVSEAHTLPPLVIYLELKLCS